MDTAVESFEAHLENILQADDADRVSEPFGSYEQKVSHVVLFLSAIPHLLIPISLHYFRKRLLQITVLVIVFIAALFFIIQYRFGWIVHLLNRFENNA